jgi:hypothetical protein
MAACSQGDITGHYPEPITYVSKQLLKFVKILKLIITKIINTLHHYTLQKTLTPQKESSARKRNE